MTFTYNAGATTDLNRVRFEIDDILEATPLFTDAELNDLLNQEGNSVLGAAAHACEILANRYARQFSFRADGAEFRKGGEFGLSITMALRAKSLRARQGSTTQMPTRKDGYSDDIDVSEATHGARTTFDIRSEI